MAFPERTTTIKALQPYKGGDETVWTLHQLDIRRKHERLIYATPGTDSVLILGSARQTTFGLRPVERLDGKTILARLPTSENFMASHGNVFPTISVTFNEAGAGLANEDALPTLRKFAERIAGIIKAFEKRFVKGIIAGVLNSDTPSSDFNYNPSV